MKRVYYTPDGTATTDVCNYCLHLMSSHRASLKCDDCDAMLNNIRRLRHGPNFGECKGNCCNDLISLFQIHFYEVPDDDLPSLWKNSLLIKHKRTGKYEIVDRPLTPSRSSVLLEHRPSGKYEITSR